MQDPVLCGSKQSYPRVQHLHGIDVGRPLWKSKNGNTQLIPMELMEVRLQWIILLLAHVLSVYKRKLPVPAPKRSTRVRGAPI